MYKTGHYGMALVVYAPIGAAIVSIDPGLAILGGVGTVGLARLPDYDHRVPLIAHRGITHTLAFLLATVVALAAVGWLLGGSLGTTAPRLAALGAVVGVAAVGSHLLADVLTPAGAPLLWPISARRFSVDLTTASNPLANYGLLAVGVAVTVGMAYLVGQL